MAGVLQNSPSEGIIVTSDAKWIYHFDPEKEMSSIQWKIPSSPSPSKAKVTLSNGKVILSYLRDCEGIIMTDYLENGQTITGDFY